MTLDEIIKLATQTGWQMPAEWDSSDGFSRRLERFAALVAAVEREACAKVCDEVIRDLYIMDGDALRRGDASEKVLRCSSSIRARGEK